MNAIVEKLTLAGRSGCISVVLLALVMLPGRYVAASGWQSLDAIKGTATDFIEARLKGSSDNTRVEAGFLDPRLKLAACTGPLEAFVNRGTGIRQATTVGVRCTGDERWKVYVPVTIVTTASVVVAAGHLPQGTLVTADKLRIERHDVTRNRSGYYTSIDAAVGQRVTRPVLEGQILAPNVLAAANVIRRGQSVTLVVTTGSVNIKMSGKALADGAVGQRIRVENLNSGRVVEGVVRSREHVEILVISGRDYFSGKAKGSVPVADTRLSNNDR